MGRFVIHGYVGQGDLGVVFRAASPTGGKVAVKLLRELDEAHDPARVTSLANRLTELRHSHLVPVLEHGVQEGVTYLVQGFVEGATLAEHVRAGDLHVAGTLTLLRELADALDHCHRSGFVHGALKPAQVILDEDGHAHLTDLGLAPLQWQRPDCGGGVVSTSTAPYAAPEVVRGGRPHPAADRYALAAIAHQLLSIHGPIPSAMQSVLLRGLAAEPLARWPTCTEMVEALMAAAGDTSGGDTLPRTGEGEWTRETGAGDRAPGRAHRARRFIVVAGLALALLGAAVGSASSLVTRASTVGITLSSSTVEVGGAVAITASNLPPGQQASVQMHTEHEQIGLVRADGSGVGRARVVLPQDATPGDHVISICWDDACHGSAHLNIVVPVQPSPTPTVSPIG